MIPMRFADLSPVRKYQAVLVCFAVIFAGLLVPPFLFLEPNDHVEASGSIGSAGDIPTATGSLNAGGVASAPDAVGATNEGATASGAEGANRPGASAGTSTNGASVSTGAGGDPLTASDTGVTSTEIRLGVLIFTLATASDFGVSLPGLSPEEQKEAWETFIAEQNERGGILGRTIVPVYKEFEPTDAASIAAACVFMGEDADVFAVTSFGGYSGEGPACLTQRYGLPYLVRAGARLDDYVRAGGNLISTGEMPHEHILQAQVWYLDQVGELTDKTIGIIAFDGAQGIIESGLVAPLRRAGFEVEHISYFSRSYGSGASQVPVEVLQMRSAGVDAIFVGTEIVTTSFFTQDAEAANYFPRYWVSNYLSMIGDTPGRAQGQRSWQNMLGVTTGRQGEIQAGLPTPDYDRECEDRFEAGTGRRPNAGNDHRILAMVTCSHVDIFVRAAQDAGPVLTREAWRNAVSNIGDLAIAEVGPASFVPGKPGAPDAIRPVRWGVDCACIVPIGDFVSPPNR